MNNIKYTIPFLLAFLIIPIGIAYAQETPGQEDFTDEIGAVGVTDELMALESVLDDYLTELEIEQDVEHKEYLNMAITKMEIVRAMLQVSQNSTDIDARYQDLSIQDLLALLDQTYGPADYPATNSADVGTYTHVDTTSKGIDGIYFVTHSPPEVDILKNNNHYQTQYDCVDRRTLGSSSLSVLTSYTDGTATITGTFNYPEEMDKNIRERRSLDCLNFEHEKTVKRHDVMISLDPRERIASQICTLTEVNPRGSESVECNAFGANRLTVITTMNEYDGTDTSKSTQLGTTGVTLLFTLP